VHPYIRAGSSLVGFFPVGFEYVHFFPGRSRIHCLSQNNIREFGKVPHPGIYCISKKSIVLSRQKRVLSIKSKQVIAMVGPLALPTKLKYQEVQSKQ
jgi:hypothetical protein